MIFSLTDETYSVLCACRSMDEQERHWDAWFWISLLDQAYWVIGSAIGALLGKALPVDFTGIDFAMTALFVVILLEHVLGKERKTKMAAVTGGVISLVAQPVCFWRHKFFTALFGDHGLSFIRRSGT